MNTRIEPDNPHGCDRYGFAWHHVPADTEAHLDFGCGDGRFLAGLAGKNIKRLVGVDISRDAVRRARAAGGTLDIRHLERTTPLPFADRTFASVTLLDVLEHVYAQGALLDELRRVLHDDGTLIVTVPGRHLFSCMDMGNLKFRFPRLHRWHYCRTHTAQDYAQRYVAHPDGLVGDVSARKGWHEHFSRPALAALLQDHGFAAAAFDGAGFFARGLKPIEMLLGRFAPLRPALKRIRAWDARRFASTHLFCLARKRDSSP